MKSTESSLPPAGTPPPSFRARLQSELARRCTDNPQYSLRAFALDMGTDHASLSQLLRGRRALTETMIRRLASKLGLAPVDVEAFVRRERLSSSSPTDEATVLELQTLSQYAAAIVTEWEHMALLELTHVKGFRADVGWIARVLGIETDRVTLALNRLLHLGLLVMEDESTWRDVSGPTVFAHGASEPSAFGRAAAEALVSRMHALAPAPASDALPQEHGSTTLAVSSRRVPEALERLRAARAEIAALLEEGDEKDEVYRLELRLYPITKLHEPRH